MKNIKLFNFNVVLVYEVVIVVFCFGVFYDFFLVLQLNMIVLVCIGIVIYVDEGLYVNICYVIINM